MKQQILSIETNVGKTKLFFPVKAFNPKWPWVWLKEMFNVHMRGRGKIYEASSKEMHLNTGANSPWDYLNTELKT